MGSTKVPGIYSRSQSLPVEEFIKKKLPPKYGIVRVDSNTSNESLLRNSYRKPSEHYNLSEQVSFGKDSGVASEHPSFIGSDFASDPPSALDSEPPSQCQDAYIQLPEMSRHKRHKHKLKREDSKSSTIRQHYYPEGGWGYIVCVCATIVQILSHGFHLSIGVVSFSLQKEFHVGPLSVGKSMSITFYPSSLESTN